VPDAEKLEKAKLTPVEFQKGGDVKTDGEPIEVQFNPETLSVTYSNQKSGGDQRGGAALQYVGQGATKLSMELWFDVSQPLPRDIAREADAEGASDAARERAAAGRRDVRELTERVIAFVTPTNVCSEKKPKWKVPGVRFEWGTFIFTGVVDGVTEKLDFFSEDGRPLRAQMSLSMSNQEIQHEIGTSDARGESARRAEPPPAGTTPRKPARDGQSVQDMAAESGRPEAWRDIAAGNGIENPRSLQPGQLVDMNPERPAGGRFGAAASASGGFSASGSLTGGGDAGTSVRARTTRTSDTRSRA
jgi:hypothetical protein